MKTNRTYDVVVVGSGGAGLRAAVGAAQNGAKTLLVCRGKVNRSGATLLAGANISADIACDGKSLYEMGISDRNKDDSKQKFFEDVIHEGFYLNREELVQLFVETAPQRIDELMKRGMRIHGLEGTRGISTYGSDILDSLMQWLSALDVDVAEDTVLTDLLSEQGAVRGVVLLDVNEGETEFVACRAVVMATGGSHDLYPHNSGSTDLCGEGPGAALRAGCELVDMEMVTFCPTIMLYPERFRGNLLPYVFTGHSYAVLLNKFGKTFTANYLSPSVEDLALNTEWDKMLLSYVIEQEIAQGNGTMHGGVYCAIPQQPANILQELYRDLPNLKTGIYKDIMQIIERGEALVVSPAAHYFDGGIRISADMSTNIAGLFAAGECTGGLFGANRVSAATTEMLIEGAKAGESAALYAKQADMPAVTKDALDAVKQELEAPFARKTGVRAAEILHKLRKTMSESLNVIRCEEKLQAGLETVYTLMQDMQQVSIQNTERKYNREWMEYIQLRNALYTAAAMYKSAALRKESRGVHIRSDCFFTDNDNFLQNIVVAGRELSCRMQPVKNRMPVEKGVFPYSEYIEKVVKKLS